MKTNGKLKPTVFAIFGGSGDLTWRKLMPSLFNLFQDGSMPEEFMIIILDRIDFILEDLRKHFREGIDNFSGIEKVTDKIWNSFSKHIDYKEGDFTKPEINK